MYTRAQKESSSVSPTSTHKKSNGSDGSRSFSVQRQPEINSSQEKEIPSYSRNAADSLIANVMRSMEAREQGEEAKGHKGQEKQGAASVAEVVMRRPESPIAPAVSVSQASGGIGIQRQCSECAEEQQEQSTEDGKDFDEMSLGAGAIQSKLTVGAPGDQYEQEADQVAAQVMSMSVTPDSSPQVQRFGEEDNPVQRWSLARSITPLVQRQVDEQVQMRELVQRAFQTGGNQASGDLESRLNASKGGGSALAPEVRAFMEPRFGADFSSVRVHTGGEAVQMNRELGAQAFAHGSDVYFGAGKSPGNNELTAHELTHVQNTGRGITGLNLGETSQLTYIMNGVELQFKIESSAVAQYRNLRPVQYAGPEVIYGKRGSPLTSPWQTIHRSQSTGWDNPVPENVVSRGNIIAYYDSPGINVATYVGTPTSRLHVVQNFTGWVVGEPISGGGVRQLCDVAAWYSVVSLVNQNFDNPDAPPSWNRFYGNRSGTGWANTSTPPEI
jgi:hypothetical protein